MTASLPVLITANPFSGKGKNQQRVAALCGELKKLGIDSEVIWDLDERKAKLAQTGIHERFRCLVSAGGDGSIASAVNDLRAGLEHEGDTTQLPIAMLPVGNENLFAIAFDHNHGEPALAAAIARGNTRTIDAGDAGGRLFTLMASVGFDSEVVRRVDAWRVPTVPGKPLRRVSRITYAPKVAATAWGYRYPKITLEAEGETFTGAHAFVFNIGQYGFGLGLARDADPSDGLLDWVVLGETGDRGFGALWYFRVAWQTSGARRCASRPRGEDPAHRFARCGGAGGWRPGRPDADRHLRVAGDASCD